jgi:hypothetical protein
VKDEKQIQIEVMATFFMIFGAHVQILFIIEEKIPVLIKWSYWSHPIESSRCASKIVIIFGACRPISFEHVSFRYFFLEPHRTTYHSNIEVSLRKAIE